MLKPIKVLLQYLTPQHALSRFAGFMANARMPWLKRRLIAWFIKRYQIDLSEAAIENEDAFACFNDFFIRQLKPNARPITTEPNAVASPADGSIAQIGHIHANLLLQAKQFYFDLPSLFGNDAVANQFIDGTFTTIYLAPNNYHRVHMPIDGQLIKTIYIPGKLFSVNQLTAEYIPNLYSRNERLVCIFQTQLGLMTVILVGAMIVGSIQTTWMSSPIRAHKIISETFAQGRAFKIGEELGYFKLGSTVLVLFEKNKISWVPGIARASLTRVGELLGVMCHPEQGEGSRN